MSNTSRPLSPHLQVYQPQLTSMLSISHRATGIVLSAGTLALMYWLLALAAGPETYAAAQAFFGSFLGRVALFVWTFCLFYHLCNGIRHLFWDAGYGFDLKIAYATGTAAVGLSVVLTLGAWIMGYAMRGGA